MVLTPGDAGVDRIARMEAEAMDIPAEERRASERIRQIDSQKIQQLKELNSRSKVRTLVMTVLTLPCLMGGTVSAGPI